MQAADLVMELLADSTKKKVFQALVKAKTLRQREIELLLAREGIENCEAREKLAELVDDHVIGEKVTPIKDFNSYYLTADGLSLGRQLRRLQQV